MLQPSGSKLLIIGGAPITQHILKTRLTVSGYKVYTATKWQRALGILINEKPALVILDTFCGIKNRYNTCNQFKSTPRLDIPLVVLTSSINFLDQASGLRPQVIRYLTKPFAPQKLEFYIQSCLQMTYIMYKSYYTYFPEVILTLTINFKINQIKRNNIVLHLTSTEFHLLKLLLINQGKALSRNYILQNMWGYIPEYYGNSRVVDVYISRLRSKLETNPNKPEFIVTIRGIGYQFKYLKSFRFFKNFLTYKKMKFISPILV